MIKFDNTQVYGWEASIRGMRNAKNSWDKIDSDFTINPPIIGSNDLKLMKTLRQAGTDHRKYLRMITVYVDITAPLYWQNSFCQ